MFALDERVVYPGHGVAKVSRIIEKKISGSHQALYFELVFISKPMTILVPVENVENVGIRRLNSPSKLADIFQVFKEPSPASLSDQIQINWNKKNKEYQGKIRTGDLRAICEIYRDLSRMLAAKKGLSYGEQELLKKTENLLIEEIGFVYELVQEKAALHLRQVVQEAQQAILAAGQCTRAERVI